MNECDRLEFANELNLFDGYENALPAWVLRCREGHIDQMKNWMLKLAYRLRRLNISFKLSMPIAGGNKRLRLIDVVIGSLDLALVSGYDGGHPLNSPYRPKSERMIDIERQGFDVLCVYRGNVDEVVDEVARRIRQKEEIKKIEQPQVFVAATPSLSVCAC